MIQFTTQKKIQIDSPNRLSYITCKVFVALFLRSISLLLYSCAMGIASMELIKTGKQFNKYTL